MPRDENLIEITALNLLRPCFHQEFLIISARVSQQNILSLLNQKPPNANECVNSLSGCPAIKKIEVTAYRHSNNHATLCTVWKLSYITGVCICTRGVQGQHSEVGHPRLEAVPSPRVKTPKYSVKGVFVSSVLLHVFQQTIRY